MLDIARQRLVRTFLARSSLRSPREVVATLGAVQAQDFDGARWAVGQRTARATDADVERAFQDGQLIRTHLLRPTWHLVDASDVRWMLALTGPAVKRHMAPYNRHLELDERIFRRANTAIERALRDGGCLTRADLKVALGRARIGSVGVQRTAHIMMRAELDGLICSGPRMAGQFTYALLDERVPSAPARDRDEALHDLALRYFRTRAPATAGDFGWWSGLPMTDVRRAIELASSELEPMRADGAGYFVPRHATVRKPAAAAHLLPNYDEFFIGYRDRSAIGRRLGSVRVVTGGSALIGNVVVIDGQLVGGWKRKRRADVTVLAFSFLTKLTRSERSRVHSAIARFRRFLQAPLETSGI